MLTKLKNKKEGFTIIEVMIVLAIAGLIILIVLLAIPALQRNSRNTAMKNDASAVTAAVNEFKSNNDGINPSTAGSLSSGSTLTISGTSGSTPATGKIQDGTTVTGVVAAPGVYTATTSNTIYVLYKFKCNTANYVGASSVTANDRAIAVIYPSERSGSTVPDGKCIDS